MISTNALNANNMRNANRLTILNILRKEQLSRINLSRKIGMTRAGISLIVDSLLKEGIIEEIMDDNYAFRKSTNLRLNPDYAYSLGLSLTRSSGYIGVLNFTGEKKTERILNIDNDDDIDSILKHIEKQIDEMIKELGCERNKILGLGITTPGPVDVENGKILTPRNFTKWHNVAICERLKALTGFSCYLENKSTALTMVEKSVNTKYENFLLLEVDDGVGTGIVLNNTLYHGKNYFSSEIGHMTIDLNGRQCSCGNKGCLTQYASIPSILVKENTNNFKCWQEVMDAAYNGHASAMELVRREANYLSAAIISINNILELDAVILAGKIDYRPGLLIALIRENIDTKILLYQKRQIHIEPCSVNEKHHVLAAGTIVLERFFQDQLS